MSAHFRDLDDTDGLVAADRDGLLRSAAMSGAHVRAVAHAVAEGALDRLTDLRPRAVVLVTGRSAAADRAARFVVALLASRFDAPLVVTPSLPGWIGPLDVVVVAGDDPGDRAYADASQRALRRRAELVTAVPVEGPVADAIGSDPVADLSPRLRVDDRFAFARLVAVFVAVCTAFDSVRLHPAPSSLADIADLLDAEAAADHPSHESFHNQAKLLALRVAGRPVVWAGDTPASTVLAAHIASTVFTVAGIASAADDEQSALARLRVSAHSGASAADSIFYDPDFDDAPPAEQPRVILVTTANRGWGVEQRVSALGDVDVVTEQSDAPDYPGGLAEQPRRDPEFSDVPADLSAYLTVAVRADLASAYLELAGETA
ncbi:hypothetical protein SAMN04488550_3190 [Gordonia malaquae]|uniref:Bifunctional glucose-6-phosphate/mannose-6-phosphate isomerase C-terminal domain-containing protein n=1 Tax=Gordonia malaquae NBRC 108250 TaxID=1223542 RepID=M3TE09_GORML|nr:hypothetical protein [Gordonia malaquae]GAC79656.1 hypothetical protein GM1_011_00840 [Gordonia malaquae NBRC 108250]SED79337.1 hypothetical protein SAMN04488550_3190 [Gordonia malaquae]